MSEVNAVDCRNGLRGLSDNTAHMVLTDPPYFLHRMDDKWDNNALRSSTNTQRIERIGGLPAGMRFDPAQGKSLYEFLLPVTAECLRVVRPGGFFVCFASPRLAHRAAVAMEDAGWEIRDMIAWCHNGGQFKAFTVDHFVRRRTDLTVLQKEKIIDSLGSRTTPQLRPMMEMIVLGQAPREGTFVDNWMAYETGLMNIRSLVSSGSSPANVMHYRKASRKFGHLTPKPVDLLRHLIRLFCVKGGTVLDPFTGSGSSGAAAVAEGCSFVGFEIDPNMAKIADRRINEVLSGDDADVANQESWMSNIDAV